MSERISEASDMSEVGVGEVVATLPAGLDMSEADQERLRARQRLVGDFRLVAGGGGDGLCAAYRFNQTAYQSAVLAQRPCCDVGTYDAAVSSFH